MKKSFFILYLAFFSSPVFAAGTHEGLCAKATPFVKQFLDLDFNGGRLKTNPQVDAMTEGPEQPAWDAAAVINQYQILSCTTTGSEAVVTVSFDVVGTVSSSSHLDHPDFGSESRREKHRFHVIAQDRKLRLRDMATFRPHVSLEAAVQDVQSLARQDSADPAVTKGADRAIRTMKKSFAHHENNNSAGDSSGNRQPASVFEP